MSKVPLETLAKKQNISCDISGPIKAICFPLPWVRGQNTEYIHTHTISHMTRALVLCLRLFNLCTFLSFSSASLFIFVGYLSLYFPIFSYCLNSSGAPFLPLSFIKRSAHGVHTRLHPPLVSLRARVGDTSLGLLYSCTPCFSLGKTRWNVLRLTLMMLSSLSALLFFQQKIRKWPTGSSVWSVWSESVIGGPEWGVSLMHVKENYSLR